MVQKSANLKCRIKQHHNKDTSMSRDYNQFPDDENGNVLWQMHQDGDDLQEAHEIEFSLVLSDEEQADRCALYLLKEEQKISLFQDEESATLEWIITIYVYMEPTNEETLDREQWFSKIAPDIQDAYGGWRCMVYVYDDGLDAEESSLRSSGLCLSLNIETPLLPGFFS